MPVPTVGQRCKFYGNTGTVGTPVWDEFTAISDLSIPDLEMGVAELKRRGNNFTKNLATLVQSFSVDCHYNSNLDTTTYGLLKTEFLAGTAKQYAVMDGAVASAGSMGLKIPLLIKSFPWDQAQESVIGHDLKFVVAYYEEPAGTEIDPAFFTAT